MPPRRKLLYRGAVTDGPTVTILIQTKEGDTSLVPTVRGRQLTLSRGDVGENDLIEFKVKQKEGEGRKQLLLTHALVNRTRKPQLTAPFQTMDVGDHKAVRLWLVGFGDRVRRDLDGTEENDWRKRCLVPDDLKEAFALMRDVNNLETVAGRYVVASPYQPRLLPDAHMYKCDVPNFEEQIGFNFGAWSMEEAWNNARDQVIANGATGLNDMEDARFFAWLPDNHKENARNSLLHRWIGWTEGAKEKDRITQYLNPNASGSRLDQLRDGSSRVRAYVGPGPRVPAPSVDAATALAQRRRPHVAARDTRLRTFASDVRALEESLGVDRTVDSSSDDEDPEDYDKVDRRDGRSDQARVVFEDILVRSNQDIETRLRRAFKNEAIVLGAALSGCQRGWALADPFKVLDPKDRRDLRWLWEQAKEAAATTPGETVFKAFVRLFRQQKFHRMMARVAGFPNGPVSEEADRVMLECFCVGTSLPSVPGAVENVVFASLYFATVPFVHAVYRESHCLTGTRHLLYFYQRAITTQQCACKLASLEMGYNASEELAGRATLEEGADAGATPRPMEDSDDEDELEAFETATLDNVEASLAALALGDPRRRDRLKARLQAMLDSNGV